MKKKFTGKLIAFAVCACLAVSGLPAAGQAEVLAQDVKEGYTDTDIRDGAAAAEDMTGAEEKKSAQDTGSVQDAQEILAVWGAICGPR